MTDHKYGDCELLHCLICLHYAGGGMLVNGMDFQVDAHKGLINIRSWETITEKDKGFPEDETLFNIFNYRDLDQLIYALTWFKNNLPKRYQE